MTIATLQGRCHVKGQLKYQMKTRFAAIAALLASVLIFSSPVLAHHGGAAYDGKVTATLKATITQVSFINPHVLIYFDAKDESGNVDHWVCEAADPAVLLREGWKRDTLKPGDQVTIMGHPAKSGAKTMRFEKVILANGKELQGQNLPQE